MSRTVVMLRDRGGAVPDAQDCHSIASPALRYRETQRGVAEFIAFGAWCDPLAWDSIFTEEERLDLAKFVRKLRRDRARR